MLLQMNQLTKFKFCMQYFIIFYSIKIQMYIDSPQFVRRKVVNNKSQMMGGFGYQRLQLANYVSNQLNNNHKDDAQILQRFRNEAQQYKRNLLRRKHSPSQPLIQANNNLFPTQRNFMPQPVHKQDQRNNTGLQHIKTQKSEQNFNTSKPTQKSIVIHQVLHSNDQTSKQLVKLVQRKDKQLEKQAKIIRKNQLKINDLRKRIQILQHQKRQKQASRIAALQDNSYQKLKGYIASMSAKLTQNNSLLNQNLSQVHQTKKKSLNSNKSLAPQFSLQPNISKKVRKSLSPLPSSSYSEYEPNPQPKIAYNYSYRVVNQKQIKEQKNNINTMLSNLGSNRNRLDAMGSYL